MSYYASSTDKQMHTQNIIAALPSMVGNKNSDLPLRTE